MPTYNQGTLKRCIVILIALAALFAFAPNVVAQEQTEPRPAGQLLLVLPFENKSTAPGLEWIGESFPEVLNQRMAYPALFIIKREDRLFAFDRMGVPATSNPSRATIYTLAQAMDVDYAILGSYNYDGRNFSATAQVLDMNNLHLSKAVTESGPLTGLISIQTALAYDLLSQLDVGQLQPRPQFIAGQPQVRLDSLENYVRGVLAPSQPEKIRRFKEAVNISPDYTYAKLQLARTYFAERDYEQSASWFAKISRNSPQSLEASFFYGICEYQLGDLGKAQDAFQFVAAKLPLIEVENNLGVVLARKNKTSAIEYFRRAVQTDPRDADYRFNLAVALEHSGDPAEAIRQAKEGLAIRPGDAEARALLDQISRTPPAATPTSIPQAPQTAGVSTPVTRNLVPRLKRNYDETAFRQAELEMRNLEEATLASKGSEGHAKAHIDRGNEMLASGFAQEAEREFREALTVDPQLADAHLGLARTAELQKSDAQAAAEANASLKIKNNALAHVILAQVDLRKNDVATALSEINTALALDPKNAEALTLKRDISARPPAKQAISDLN